MMFIGTVVDGAVVTANTMMFIGTVVKRGCWMVSLECCTRRGGGGGGGGEMAPANCTGVSHGKGKGLLLLQECKVN
jgi:hypothetical protein